MYKVLPSDKDTYITNRVINGSSKAESNVGGAATLDLFKLYDFSSFGGITNVDLTRILIHFDLTELKSAYNSGKIDIDSSSFWCKLNLKDVYGGQPTPAKFDVNVFPLSSSFEEGPGKDVALYSDYATSNWLSSSYQQPWIMSGCASSGDSLSLCDYITSSLSLPSTLVSQHFEKGDEDLLVDVTKIISATLAGEIPDSGFRISFSEQQEQNQQTYFVKRFGAKNVYDARKRPKLIFGYDDSLTDDSQNLTVDYSNKINLYNFVAGQLTNLLSGGIDVTGNNCINLRLEAQVSGSYTYDFLGSQTISGKNYSSGTYSVDNIVIPSDGALSSYFQTTGSVNFKPIWMSSDLTKTFVTGSLITFRTPRTSSSADALQKLIVNVQNLKESYRRGETDRVVVYIFDKSQPYIKTAKIPVELPGIIYKFVYYRVVDAVTKDVIIPFDTDKGSTRVSNDANGMYFDLDTSSLTPGRSYAVDIMVVLNGKSKIFSTASPNFVVDVE